MAANDASSDDEDWLVDDVSHPVAQGPALAPWKVLVVDDEPDIHSVTKLAIRSVEYAGRGLSILGEMSAEGGFRALQEHPDVALVLLDVVMETEDAGLKLVKRIREELGNKLTRIVLRTGQPGQAPEQEVILGYDINDYKAKTELTAQKLYTTVISSLRSYETLLALERSRQGLSKILEGSSNLYQLHSLREFASGVLKQIGAILNVGTEGILCVAEPRQPDSPDLQVIGGTGMFSDLADSGRIGNNHPVYPMLARAANERRSIFDHPNEVLYFPTQSGREFVVYFTPPWPLTEVERDLLEVYCNRISAAFDNLYFYSQMQRAQEATVVALADLAEYRDNDTGEHVQRVQRWSTAIAQRLKSKGLYVEQITPRFLELIGMASILHDVGKVGTPDHVLFKPGRHDPDERVIMEQHAKVGASILKKSAGLVEGTSYLSMGAEIAGGHHEHYDGQGYPNRRKGDAIPLSARIVAVVDVFDALIHKRPYKEPWPLEEAIKYIQDRSGTQFDPNVIDVFLELVREQPPNSCSSEG
ncbi:DUF3369 domain-containing protein [Parachitinimonas caeni]|uniref:DUF3369 domain-containing protein n=1 Tax=Parachitinimonas caeni TaxID=3031301 RepID=A0ABT7DZY2_9NEIS|nr:DUF3369 domain-containing protein [Parachitinimonas caeni]MDK2124643.1 DUF3369 domain-containing protein [Parachitinimonas caeni]